MGCLSRAVSVHRGLCPGGFLSRRVSVQGGLSPHGSLSRRVSLSGRPPYGKEQAVRILLECILVYSNMESCGILTFLKL